MIALMLLTSCAIPRQSWYVWAAENGRSDNTWLPTQDYKISVASALLPLVWLSVGKATQESNHCGRSLKFLPTILEGGEGAKISGENPCEQPTWKPNPPAFLKSSEDFSSSFLPETFQSIVCFQTLCLPQL